MVRSKKLVGIVLCGLYLFSSCQNDKKQFVPLVEKKIVSKIDSVKSFLNDSISKDEVVVIEENLTNEVYHLIYIDTTHKSKYYKMLSDFEFSEYDLQAYNSGLSFIKAKRPNSLKKLKSFGINKNWLPIYLYKDNYYLYAPSDWGNAGRRIINDSVFVFWYMDGPLPTPINKIKKLNSENYYLEIDEYFNEDFIKRSLEIIQIDKKTKLSVFKYSNGKGNYSYELYIPVENAKELDLIVNYCENNKQLEFNFDKIDFEKLLK